MTNQQSLNPEGVGVEWREARTPLTYIHTCTHTHTLSHTYSRTCTQPSERYRTGMCDDVGELYADGDLSGRLGFINVAGVCLCVYE